MKFCIECGSQLKQGAIYCEICGAKINKDDKPITTTNDNQQPNKPSNIWEMGMQLNPNQSEIIDPFERILDITVNPEETLLVDSYHGIIATINGDSYTEITLNIGSDDKYYLNKYSKSGNYSQTIHKAYSLSLDTANKILKKVEYLVKEYDLLSWNKYPIIGLMGGKDVIKFTDKTGKLVRVSTDQMPTEGSGVFTDFKVLLDSHIKEENRVL